ncbi:AraC-type DNA-binding protein [bacterium A37T11]|nr:AraC-type DNA-binding protein [bacterium A37T11]
MPKFTGMKSHLILYFRTACPDLQVVQEPPFEAAYTLACLTHAPVYLVGTAFAAIISEHDAWDVLVLTVEIRNAHELIVPFQTEIPDLFWLYQLKNQSLFTRTGFHEKQALFVQEGQYAQVYSEPCSGHWHIWPEHSFLQLHIIKGKWAKRYAPAINRQLEMLIRCKELTLPCTLYTTVQDIDDQMDSFLKVVRHVKTGEGMGLDGDIQQPIGHLADWHRGIGRTDKASLDPNVQLRDDQFTLDVQKRVREWIALDIPIIPTVSFVAKKMGVNRQYIWDHYNKFLGEKKETLIQFIIRAKLEESKRLMVEYHYTPYDVVAHLNFADYAAFSNQFKQAYEMTPIQFYKAIGK